ncbi:sigma-70 family RNA polymerase sigma factor [Kribbella sandramycini]|uniref:RNA polymerase sigma factor (Sigma-70 family) n=1 Tax=Kribbella sandramycini TaxID=60450 RepID=A0A7Y4KXG3_9ACTN|nr:sigma-70 family RNA polymerase sigma factor [Kribbella sandramycini]MBB6569768.1 RNA polymerase sigma factor (sigma-70 family) [Kribbella sandramycini]NOL40405.1 sigma-70 family RNA polymerase sigma factor [Kribbella sandramycini]
MDDVTEAVEVFVRLRPRLVRIAHRILSGASEAEDVVQETWLRWQRTDRTAIRNPQALLVTTTTRIALNVAQSGRRRHEVPMDFGSVEILDTAADPATRAENHQAAEQVLLVMLASLSRAERTAYLLREVHDCSYEQIAATLDIELANSRQLVCRARRRLTLELAG